MPDEHENRIDDDTLPDTSLHAYKEGREEDVEGDVEKLKEGDPEASQREEIAEGSDSESNWPEHDKA